MSRPMYQQQAADRLVRIDDEAIDLDQLCALLTDSIHSLASDASELRMLSVVATQVGDSSHENTRTRTAESLRHLHETLLRAESQVQRLDDIMSEEKMALGRIQHQHDSAMLHREQLAATADFLSQTRTPRQNSAPSFSERPALTSSIDTELALRPKRMDTGDMSSGILKPNDTHERTAIGSMRRPRRDSLAPHPFAERPTLSSSIDAQPALRPPPTGTNDIYLGALKPNDSHQRTDIGSTRRPRRDSLAPHVPSATRLSQKQPLNLVSRDELEAIPRTCRGRISLSVVNDALRDIATLHVKKSNSKRAWIGNSHAGMSQSKHPLASSNAYVSAKENLSHPEANFVISEQELRQSCSFFRSGESTARSILLILRTLGRLKQVPAKGGEVQYIVVDRQ
jgi:hypothetical protein